MESTPDSTPNHFAIWLTSMHSAKNMTQHLTSGIFSEDNVSHEDYFQDAFILVWTEIQNKRIHVVNDAIYRTQADGTDAKMTAKLKSYIMTIVRNQYIKSKRPVRISLSL